MRDSADHRGTRDSRREIGVALLFRGSEGRAPLGGWHHPQEGCSLRSGRAFFERSVLVKSLLLASLDAAQETLALVSLLAPLVARLARLTFRHIIRILQRLSRTRKRQKTLQLYHPRKLAQVLHGLLDCLALGGLAHTAARAHDQHPHLRFDREALTISSCIVTSNRAYPEAFSKRTCVKFPDMLTVSPVWW